MSGLLDSLGDAFGGVASGVADFLVPEAGRSGAGFSPTDILNSFGDALTNSPFGQIGQIGNVLGGVGTTRQKLFGGALLAAGAGAAFAGARHMSATNALERAASGDLERLRVPKELHFAGSVPEFKNMVTNDLGLPAPELPLSVPVKRWSEPMGKLGLRERGSATTPGGEARLRLSPGLPARTADIVGAQDVQAVSSLLMHSRFSSDLDAVTNTSRVIADYAASITELDPTLQLGAAQHDLAKVDIAVRHGLIRTGATPGNAEFLGLWDKLMSGTLAAGEEQTRLLSRIESFAGSTRDVVAEDLTFDLAAKIKGVDFTDAGPVLRVSIPQWHDDLVFTDQAVRSKRIMQLNMRAQAATGVENLEYLLKRAIADVLDRDKGGKGNLPNPLKRSGLPDSGGWYVVANREIFEAHGLLAPDLQAWVTPEHLTAAVSLSSEGADWDGNIKLATNSLIIAHRPEAHTAEFQAWLSSPEFNKFLKAKMPTDTPNGKLFVDLHNEVKGMVRDEEGVWQAPVNKKDGNKLSGADFAKIMRLRTELPADLFKTTMGKKQKNFYLNLWDPSDPAPVTVDRHQHDIFWGLASGSDFKAMEGSSLGDSNYDIIADGLRELADKYNLAPNVVQGYVWEAWRDLKAAHMASGSLPWKKHDPFVLHPDLWRGDGSKNPVLEALQGRFGVQVEGALSAMPNTIPLVLEGTDKGFSIYPGDAMGVVASPDTATSRQFRHLFPAFLRADGQALWGRSRPRVVWDVYDSAAKLAARAPGSTAETWRAEDWQALGAAYPGLVAEPSVQVLIDDGFDPVEKFDGIGAITDPGVAGVVARPELLRERLSLPQLQADTFMDPERSPLLTHAWAAISAEVHSDQQIEKYGLGVLSDADQVARHNRLGAKLRAAGYKPIEQVGMYDSPEKSWLVFGISPEEASKFGDMFHQDSVITNDGYWYGQTAYTWDGNEPGTVRAVNPGEINFDQSADNYYSEVQLGGTKVKWAAGVDWDNDPTESDAAARWAKQTTPRQRIVNVQLSPAAMQDLPGALAKIEAKGGRIHGVYAPGSAPPEGYVNAREHVMTDGSQVHVLRTADPEISSPHGVNVWVKQAEADGLPRTSPAASTVVKVPSVVPHGYEQGSFVVNDGVVIQPLDAKAKAPADPSKVLSYTLDGKKPAGVVFGLTANGPVLQPFFVGDSHMPAPGDVRIVNGRFIFDADPSDLTRASEFVDAVKQLGYDPSMVTVNSGPAAAGTVTAMAPTKGVAQFVEGSAVPRIRRASNPLPEVLDRFGIEYDPHWVDETTGSPMTADQRVHDSVSSVLEKFYSGHSEMVSKASLTRVGFGTFDDPNEGARYFTGGGGSVELNPLLVTDYEAEHQIMLKGIDDKFHPPGFDDHITFYLAHELGHMVHQAVRLSFTTVGKQSGDWEREALRPIFSRLKKKEARGMIEALSKYAATDLDEFCAEAVAEAVFSQSPRPLALEVYGLLMGRFETNMAGKKMSWNGLPESEVL